MTSSLVGVDQAFTCNTVNYWCSLFVCCFCCRFITGFDRVVNFFDVSAHHRAYTDITTAVNFCLSSAFSC